MRSRLVAALVALALVLTACGRRPAPAPAPKPVPAPAPAAPKRVIVALGDSLTAGHGLRQEEAWPSLLQAWLDEQGYAYRVINAGISGDTTAGGVNRLGPLLNQKPHILILALGANDGLRGVPAQATRQNLEEIIQRSQEAGARVLLAGGKLPPNYGPDYTTAFNAIFPELAAQYDLALIPDFLDGVWGKKELNLPDGVHPNAAGQKILVQTVIKAVQPLLAK